MPSHSQADEHTPTHTHMVWLGHSHHLWVWHCHMKQANLVCFQMQSNILDEVISAFLWGEKMSQIKGISELFAAIRVLNGFRVQNQNWPWQLLLKGKVMDERAKTADFHCN